MTPRKPSNFDNVIRVAKRKKNAPKARNTLKKPIVWSRNKCDKTFSEYIRKRDGKCMFTGCIETEIKRLQCSHFWARAHSGTRWDVRNCIALCYKHHYGDRIRGWEYQKGGDYRDFMLQWLGEDEYYNLRKRYEGTYPAIDERLRWQIFYTEYLSRSN